MTKEMCPKFLTDTLWGTNESDQPDSKMSKNEAVTFQNSKSMDSYRYGKLLSLLSSNDGADNLRKLS